MLLIVGTHGRSLYWSDIAPVQQLDTERLEEEIYVYDLTKVNYSDSWGDKRRTWNKDFYEPFIDLVVYSKISGKATVSVETENTVVALLEIEIESGLNYLEYNGAVGDKLVAEYERQLNKKIKEPKDKILLEAGKNGEYYLLSGSYKVTIKRDKHSAETTLNIEGK